MFSCGTFFSNETKIIPEKVFGIAFGMIIWSNLISIKMSRTKPRFLGQVNFVLAANQAQPCRSCASIGGKFYPSHGLHPSPFCQGSYAWNHEPCTVQPQKRMPSLLISTDVTNNWWNVEINAEIFAKAAIDSDLAVRVRADDIYGARVCHATGSIV